MRRVTALARAFACSAVGKWHLGANTVEATPVGRGFSSHTGYWSGAEDYVKCGDGTCGWFDCNP